MDNRIKKLALEGLFARVGVNPGVTAEDSLLIKKDFLAKITDIIAALDESILLYLSEDAKLPEVGSAFVSRISGEDVEYVVTAIDYPNALVETTYTTDRTFYFKSTEDANNFINTGNKGSYDDWSRTKSDTYPFIATAKVIERRTFDFSNF